MVPAHPTALSPKAAYGGFIVAAVEALGHVRNTLLPLCLGLFLFLSGCSQVGHCQRHGRPEVVIPMRVKGTDIGMKAQGWLSYRLHFGGQRHIVHMKVNKHLLPRHLPVFTYTDQGALVQDHPFVQNDCYYHGYVEGDPESVVALSTCFGGFQGILKTNNVVYEIEPKNLSTTLEHLIKKVSSEETQFPPMRCGLTDEEIARQLKFQESSNYTLMQSGYKGWWTHKFILEQAVIVDHIRYLHHSSNATQVQMEVCLAVSEEDNFLSSLDVDVVLIGIEIWTGGNPVTTDDINKLVKDTCIWKANNLNLRLPHDVAILSIKKSFGLRLGSAYVGKVCDIRYNCGAVSFTDDNLYDFGYAMAHMTGHTLGMYHDRGPCHCGLRSCIMYPTRGLTTRFSNCSYSFFFNLVNKYCMYNSPKAKNIFTLTECGNSVVEEGEECDCGTLRLCMKDPCCQSNCTLRPGAACALGLCCKDCRIMPSGYVCRKQENVCDLPEWCNGTSYHCPEDVYVQDGTPCMDSGYCYGKRCNNREEKCKKLFGKAAKNANQSCYLKVNTEGDRFGNCGIQGTAYLPCKLPDILCGRVQCENVTEIPLLSDHSTVHCTYYNGIHCWGTDYHLGMTIPDIGYVEDGTECGTERICIKRKCVSMSRLASDCSPETCNMKGVCNNRHHCHCSSEWRPPDCLARGQGGSIDSGPAPTEKDEMGQWNHNLLLLWFIPLSVFSCCLILFAMGRIRSDSSEEPSIPTSPEETLPNVPTSTKYKKRNVNILPKKEEQNVLTVSKKVKKTSTILKKKSKL